MDATIQDVAKLAKVSVGSVSRYLNGHQLKPDNMDKISKAITTLGYRENFAAKSLKSNQSFAIGLLMNKQSYFSETMVAKIEAELGQAGYGILISGFMNDEKKFKSKLDFLLSRQIDGLILFEAPSEWEEVQRIKTLKIPVISVNTPLEYPNVVTIISDNRESTSKVILEMIKNGHSDIGIISPPGNDYVAKERLKGILDILEDHPKITGHIHYGDYSKESGYLGSKKIVENKKITALFVSNYNMSLGALEYLVEHDIKIGKDISFACYDYFSIRDLFKPKLTVIRPPVTEIGEKAAEIMSQQLNLSEKIAIENRIELKNNIIFGSSIVRNE